ncbi:MAG TPA: hypothetical protein VEJ23_02825 [Solirubrobacteraceae bacterium]|nr:hypothetical protein [Solirubrobacteraceae bacterium]
MTGSANLDLVRSIYADWERGDFSKTDWADPEIEFVIADGPEPGAWIGLAGMAEGFRNRLRAWQEVRVAADGYRELDPERVLVLVRLAGRGRISGLQLGEMRGKTANVFHLQGGCVTRLVVYWDRDGAFVDLGLSPEDERP